jgi:hypothetical protein
LKESQPDVTGKIQQNQNQTYYLHTKLYVL